MIQREKETSGRGFEWETEKNERIEGGEKNL